MNTFLLTLFYRNICIFFFLLIEESTFQFCNSNKSNILYTYTSRNKSFSHGFSIVEKLRRDIAQEELLTWKEIYICITCTYYVKHLAADAMKNISMLSIEGGTRLTELLSLSSNYAGIMFITVGFCFPPKNTTYLLVNLCIHVLSNSTNLISLSLFLSLLREIAFPSKQVLSMEILQFTHITL